MLTLEHIMFLQKSWSSFFGYNILTEDVFVTQLSSSVMSCVYCDKLLFYE
jgi:hypothetical protein